MMGTLHVKYRAVEPSCIITIFKVFLDLFSASTQVCYFCKCSIYFLSNFLSTKQDLPIVIKFLLLQLITVSIIK